MRSNDFFVVGTFDRVYRTKLESVEELKRNIRNIRHKVEILETEFIQNAVDAFDYH